MMYNGKLYGKLLDKYFETGKTSEDFDKMESKIKELEAEIEQLKQANGDGTGNDKCHIQNFNVRFPSKDQVIKEGERQTNVWLEGNTERELQHFRVGFRRSFEYVLRCLNAR